MDGLGLFTKDSEFIKRVFANNLIANDISDNTFGIVLAYSEGNIMRANNITNNMFNFGVLGDSSKPYYNDYVQDIDTSKHCEWKANLLLG
jgi:parallel beta-helix repeat protein